MSLRILDFKDVIELQIGKVYLYTYRGLLPDSFNDMLLFNCNAHSYNNRSKNSFRLPYSRTNVRKISRRIQRPKIFNSLNLSSEIQNASSTAVFTSKLKLFSLAFIFSASCIICSHFFFIFFLCTCAFSLFYVINKLYIYD